ncbi:MAG TPA: 5-formyltetrahydrofolate cyclo-ligase [Candidatus Omnitrophota bacterium]|nr:5-formyltetrahydrofolate cyclo-ligase [Candidatus Omnitrophota bacterium]HPD84564.1 5-formyltetrahydrofolate cyclo-ligase [Candidatus Omnitrophota bacterium]HRZ03422.1 5-formyltetrahydrofolate cyclo-ligase [Candidatus Omnitrophota bacterium]
MVQVKQNLKNAIRTKLLNLLKNQKEEDRFRKSRVILKKLFTTKEFKKANVVLFYASFDGEVDTFEMIKQAQRLGKRIALPTIIKEKRALIPCLVENLQEELVLGPYGIKQPCPKSMRPLNPQEIDLAVVPGVAFDEQNNRLGRGKGYYDRFLGNFPSYMPIFGLAFDFQIVKRLPHQKGLDVPVSRVIVN